MSQHGVNDLLKEEPTLDTLKLSKAQKHALYTLIASVKPEEKKLHPKLLNTDEWLKAEARNQALQDYDNAIKELFNG